ncbi:transglycosylase SLT domain-containing protein [candidate division KSB1 bacterium]|nr:transglycosylase SLT domain-containing protein [candidate division KSB1 bacterium]
MKKPLAKILDKQHLKGKVANINKSYLTSHNRQRLEEGAMQPRKSEIKKIMGVVFLLAFIIFQGSRFLSNDLLTSEQPDRSDRLSALIQEHQMLTAIDAERRVNVNKISSIISRYNKTMSEEDKDRIANEVYLMTRKYPNLNADFICATITHESAKTWNPTITSPVGAMGLMQIMPATGAFLAVQEGIEWTNAEKVLYDPIINIRLGCRYMSELVDMYQEDGGLAAYNAGPKRAELWLASNRNDSTLVAETRDYIPAVRKLTDQFSREGVM